MDATTIEVLGVYAIPVTDDLVREQTDILYPSLTGDLRLTAEEDCRDQLNSTVLLELVIYGRDDRYNAGDFKQPNDLLPKESWQVAYDEGYLSLNGETKLEADWPHPPPMEDLRITFFIHYWDPDKPLLSSYGELHCPPVQKMPERLQNLVPYQPVD
jgi:hypothetical protein